MLARERGTSKPRRSPTAVAGIRLLKQGERILIAMSGANRAQTIMPITSRSSLSKHVAGRRPFVLVWRSNYISMTGRSVRSLHVRACSLSSHVSITPLGTGCEVIKYSRTGKPRKTTFRLSDDEQTLSWDGSHGGIRAPVKMAKGERRNVKITEVRSRM